ncbi:MAG: ABC transporter permease [Lachnospiraceae bacterium]|nr:ABC transporter permease [Lachnospiraceae bacterium]
MKTNILTIIKKEFARFFGDKGLVFSTILLPGLMLYVLYTLMGEMMMNQFTSEEGFVASGYVQNMPAELEAMFNELPVTWQDIDATGATDVQAALTTKEADVLLVFPENFMDLMAAYDVASGEAAPNIGVYYNSTKPESSDIANMIIPMLEAYEASVTNKFDINAGQVQYNMASEKDASGQMFAMLLPMLLMTFLFTGCNSVAPESIAGEKERGTIATLLVTPMKRSSLAMGKIVSLSCIALLSGVSSFIGAMLSLPKLMGGSAGLDTAFYTASDYALLLGVILSTVLLLVALISVISAFAKSIKEAAGLCSPLMILSMVVSLVPMMGTEELNKLGMFFIPIFNSVLCMNEVFSFQVNMVHILVTIAMNIVYAGVLTFVLTKLFNSEKVMFSK